MHRVTNKDLSGKFSILADIYDNTGDAGSSMAIIIYVGANKHSTQYFTLYCIMNA